MGRLTLVSARFLPQTALNRASSPILLFRNNKIEITPGSSWCLMWCPGLASKTGWARLAAAAVRVAVRPPRSARCGRGASEGPLHGGHCGGTAGTDPPASSTPWHHDSLRVHQHGPAAKLRGSRMLLWGALARRAAERRAVGRMCALGRRPSSKLRVVLPVPA